MTAGSLWEIENKHSLLSNVSVSPTCCISHPTSRNAVSALEEEMIIPFLQMRKLGHNMFKGVHGGNPGPLVPVYGSFYFARL